MRQNIRSGGLRALLNLIRELVACAYLSYLVCGGRLSVSDFIFYFGIITGFSNRIMNAVYQYWVQAANTASFGMRRQGIISHKGLGE